MLRSDMVKLMQTTFNHLVVIMLGLDKVEMIQTIIQLVVIMSFSQLEIMQTTFNHLVVIMLGSDKVELMHTSFNHLRCLNNVCII